MPTTVISRLQLAHPDLSTTGGPSLHALVAAMYSKIGDNMSSRMLFSPAVANAATATVTHNFITAFADLRYDLYIYDVTTTELTRITSTSTPSLSQFTVSANVTNPTTQIDILNSSGSSRNIGIVIHLDPIYLREGDVKDIDLVTTAPVDGDVLTYSTSGTKFVPSVSRGQKNYIAAGFSNNNNWTTSDGNVTVATTSTLAELPRPITTKTGIKITGVSGSTAFAYYRFTLDDSDFVKKLQIQFDIKPVSGYVASDFRVDMYSNTASNYGGTSTRLALSTDVALVTALPNTTDTFRTSFDGPGGSAKYMELRIGLNSVNTNAIVVSDVIVGPGDSGSILSNVTLDNTNTANLKDTLFTLQDDGDATKQLRFQLSGISAATLRTLTVPNASDTLAVLGTAQTFTAAQTNSSTYTFTGPGTNGDLNKTGANNMMINSENSIIIGIDSDNNQTDRLFKIVADVTDGSGPSLFQVTETGNCSLGTTNTAFTGNTIHGDKTARADVAGEVGEELSATGSNGSLTSGQYRDAASVVLTRGVWLLVGQVRYVPGATTVMRSAFTGFSTLSGSANGPTLDGNLFVTYPVGYVPTDEVGHATATVRVKISSDTTYYLKAFSSFTTSTMDANTPQIRAWRIR